MKPIIKAIVSQTIVFIIVMGTIAILLFLLVFALESAHF